MTRYQKLTYTYFSQFTAFCCFSILFVFLTLLLIRDFPLLPLFLFLPFTVFFLIEESGLSKGFSLMVKIITFAAFYGSVFLLLEGLPLVLTGVCLFTTLLFTSRAKMHVVVETSGESLMAVAFNLVSVIFIYFVDRVSDIENTRLLLYVTLVLLALSAAARFVCKFYAGLNALCRNWLWRNDSVDMAARLRGRSQRLAFTFLGAGLLLTLAAAVPNYISPFAIETVIEAVIETTQTRDFPYISDDALTERWAGIELETIIDEHEHMSLYTFEHVYATGRQAAWHRWILQTFTAAAIIVAITIVLKAFLSWRFMDRTKRDRDYSLGLDIAPYTGLRPPRTRTFNLSANQRVRAIFKKKINEHRRQGLYIKPSHTAKLIAVEVSAKEDITALTDLYHTARYSGRKLSPADLAALRKRL